MGSNKKYRNGYWKVYVHRNIINGKRYVGITSQKPEYRWNNGNGYRSNKYFTSAIEKYGWDSFEHCVLYDFLTEKEAKSLEKKYITLWNTRDREYGYNITEGGESTSGFVPSKELREKWSKIRTGQKRSEETKRKLAEASRRTYYLSEDALAEAKYKPVSAFTINGEFIKTFRSIIDASKEFGLTNSQRSHISDVCKGHRKSCAGYFWQYA